MLLRYRCGGARTGFHAYAHAKSRTLILLLSDSLSAVARQRRAPQQHTGTHVHSGAAESRSVPPRRSARLPRCPPSRPRPHYITLHYISWVFVHYIKHTRPRDLVRSDPRPLFAARSPRRPRALPLRPATARASASHHGGRRRTPPHSRDSPRFHITLHYRTVHYGTLNITLRYATLRYATLRYATLRYTT